MSDPRLLQDTQWMKRMYGTRNNSMLCQFQGSFPQFQVMVTYLSSETDNVVRTIQLLYFMNISQLSATNNSKSTIAQMIRGTMTLS